MTLEDIKLYYGNSYRFQKVTGMTHSNFVNWSKIGYIPIKTQMRLEHLTNGKLKADLQHYKQEYYNNELK